MAISSGLQNAMAEGISWLCAAAIMVGGVVYHNELRVAIYPLLGIDLPHDLADAGGQPRSRTSGAAPGSDAESRIRHAEARAADAEARARQAEAKARGQQAATARSTESSRQARLNLAYTVELKQNRDGHFYANAELNGRAIAVLVDTGATMVALTYEDAQRAGINLSNSDFTGRAQTANGVARFAPVTIDQITIGAVTVRNVRGSVAEPGRMGVTLLGMSFLGRLKRTEMRDGLLVLEN
jgi:aspartyl protease family protein